MFKRISALFLLLLAPFLLTACSSSTTTNSNAKTSVDTNSKNEMPRRPDFGQPEAKPDVNGVVKSITGNEVVILKVEMGQGFKNASSTPANTQNKTTSLNLGAAAGVSGAGGGPGMGQRRQGGGTATSEERAQMMARIKEMSTGEEVITIPVGIKMLKRSSETGSREMVEATLSDITSDKMLMVWLNKDVTEKQVASFVLIN
jgi:hypothetical protein